MPTYHRSQRLKLVGAGPRVEQLQNDRYRLTFQCEATNPREAWMFGNKSQIFASYGTLSTAQMSIAGIDRRTNEAYTDAVLVATEATPTENNMIVTLVYETLGTSFVQVKDDTIDFDLNGLQRVTRESIAKVGTSFSKSIGSTAVTVDGVNCVLASLNVDNTDSYVKLIEVYLEEGTVLETTDNVGSQQAKVIETFGGDPSIPAGYSIANKEESNFQGYQTNRFTFLKDGVTLSTSEDKVGSQLAVIKEVFNGTPSAPSAQYSIAREEVSEVDGIPTRRFTFLKNDTVLSRSRDSIGSQKAVVLEIYNGTNNTAEANGYGDGSNYVLAREEESDVDGIITRRYTYLEPSVLSVQEIRDSLPKTVVVRAFNLTSTDSSFYSVGGSIVNSSTHILVSSNEEDFEGIKTSVFTYESRDYNSKSTNEFGRTIIERVEQTDSSSYGLDNQAASYTVDGVSDLRILNQTVENNDNEVNRRLTTLTTVGIDEVREELVGSQRTIVITKVGTAPTTSDAANNSNDGGDSSADFILIRDENNRVNGIDIFTYTFARKNAVVSQSEDKVGSQLAIIKEVFDGTPSTPSGYLIAREETSEVDGIPTRRFTFLKDGVILSRTEDKIGSQLAITEEVFGEAMVPTTPSGYVIAREEESDFDGISTKRFTFLKSGVILSQSFDKVGSQQAVVIEKFNEAPTVAEAATIGGAGYAIAREEKSEVEGIPTFRYTFLENNAELSKTEDFVGSQLAIVRTIFNPTSGDPTESGYSLARKEQTDFEGLETIQYTFLKDNVTLSESEDKVGSQAAIIKEVYNGTPTTPSGYLVAREEVSDFQGIPTRRFTFLKDGVILSKSEDKVGSQLAVVEEVFGEAMVPTTPSGYAIAREETSEVDGIPTRRFTFLKSGVILSQSFDKVGSQQAVIIEKFNEEPTASEAATIGGAGYAIAREEKSEVEGIPTFRYTFLENDSELSKTEDFVGSQLAIVRTIFNPTSGDPTESGYLLARKEQTDFEGLETIQYTFLKDGVILSRSEDKVGSQLAVVEEVFGNSAFPTTPSGYSIAREEESEVDGIPTRRFTFLKDNATLSTSEDKIGSQLAIVKEVFNGTPSIPSGYSIAREEESEVDGIPTKRFTFLKNAVILEQSQDLIGSQVAIAQEIFNPESYSYGTKTEIGSSNLPSGFVQARYEASNFQGIPTTRFTFLKDGVILSKSEDLIGSQQAVVIERFNAVPSTPTGYEIARKEISDFDGVETNRFTFLKPSVLQSEELFQVSQNRVRVTAFNLDSESVKPLVSSVSNDHYLLSTSTSDFEGIETFVYTFDKSSIIDVRPITKSNFSLVEAYQYTSENASPATLHAASALELPDGTSLNANATFLEASVDSSSKPSIFSQIALNTSSAFNGSTPLLIHTYQTFVPFTYPGTVDTEVQGNETTGTDQDISVSLVLEGPVRSEVQATVYEFLQSSADLVQADYTYDSSNGLWSPNQWASIKASGTTSDAGNESRFNDSQDFRGYRTVNSGTLVNVVAGADCNRLYYNGVLRLRDLEDGDDCLFTITAVEQGPSDPVGSKWVLDLDIQPLYSLSDGTTIYKKTIVVSETIPAQIDNDVPYNDS